MQNEHLKQLWITALRSGEYKQSGLALENLVGNCCLGVLCRVYDKEYPNRLFIGKSRSGKTSFSGAIVALPPEIEDMIGMTREQESNLVDMNDLKGNTFSEIADYLETL